MRTEKEIRFRIKFLENQQKKHYATMNKKYRVRDKSELEKFETAQELYYECFIEIIALKWVLGVE